MVKNSLALSVTCTVKPKDPAVVGVPLMMPVPGSKDNPGGSVPDAMDHVYGGVPPVAARVTE